jgi:hypothetical protein
MFIYGQKRGDCDVDGRIRGMERMKKIHVMLILMLFGGFK